MTTKLSQAGLGVDQSWQDVTGSRAPSTSYTNTTGKPIFVKYGGSAAGSGLTVGGVLLGSGAKDIYAVVPNNVTYTSSAGAIGSWHELR